MLQPALAGRGDCSSRGLLHGLFQPAAAIAPSESSEHLYVQSVHTPVLLRSGCIFDRDSNFVDHVPCHQSISESNFYASWPHQPCVIPPEPCACCVCRVTSLVLANRPELVFRTPVIIAVRRCQIFTTCTIRHFSVLHCRPRVVLGTHLRLCFQRRFSVPASASFHYFRSLALPPIRHTTPCRSGS